MKTKLDKKNNKDKEDIATIDFNEKSVCAVIVTYNRKHLLIKCLKALLSQSRPLQAIYIMDNASTDGTAEALLENKFINAIPPASLDAPWEISCRNSISQSLDGYNDMSVLIYYVKMHINMGGAGGFHEGVKRSFEKGFDWMWLMDDDGIPEKDCLYQLLFEGKTHKADFLAPLVIDINHSGKLSFGIFDYKNNQTIYTFQDAKKYSYDGIFEGTACLFNGILISKELVKIVGYPKKEMFIWGDEIEYLSRIKSKGLKVITICNAIHRHPIGNINYYKIFFGKFWIRFNDHRLRDYCKFRNMAFIYKNYAMNKLLKDVAKYSWFFIITRKFDIKNLLFYLSATIDGLRADFSKHRKYL